MPTRSTSDSPPTLKPYCTRILLALVFFVGLFVPAGPSVAEAQIGTYVEPGLLSAQTETVSVIVMGAEMAQAARAVERAGGTLTHRLWLIDAVAATLPTHRLDTLVAQPGVISVVNNKRVESSGPIGGLLDRVLLPYTKDGWPVSMDVGADQLHESSLLTELTELLPLTGGGVTVAVVDTGVFFAPEVLLLFDQESIMNFIGQADFVGNGACPRRPLLGLVSGMVQRNGYCFQNMRATVDGYGHGSHVAGAIGNRVRDWETDLPLGVAPDARILSVRVLDDNGYGSYVDAIEGIQYVVEQKETYGIRVLNLSLSAQVTTPYFADPLNRAVERAWAEGIVVVAAAGNGGPGAETITVPGNDPYVITVGAVNTRRTAADWSDDVLPTWSATGPTLDGFSKPDVLAPGGDVVSFMYNNPYDRARSARLALMHPDYSVTTSLFRMNGTSMATAVASGVVALMLQAHPELTPDQVKYRLIHSAQMAMDTDGQGYNQFQQGAGRIWAPDAVLGSFPADARANQGMDIWSDLAHGWSSEVELSHHYEGAIRRMQSDDGRIYLYYGERADGAIIGLGAAWVEDKTWIDWDLLTTLGVTWDHGALSLDSGMTWSGGLSQPADQALWSGTRGIWSGTRGIWSGTRGIWSGTRGIWSGTTKDPSSASISSLPWVSNDTDVPSGGSSYIGKGTGIFGKLLQTLGSLLSRRADGVEVAPNFSGTDQTIYLPSILR